MNGVWNKRQLRLGEQGLIALGDLRLSGGLGGTILKDSTLSTVDAALVAPLIRR